MTDLDRRILLGMASVAGIAAVAGAAQAGSLNPPSGPVTPTMKALDQVEPRTPVQSLTGDATSQYIISQPGSYYLTGNITGLSGMNGIRITANNVSLDLCGFAMMGVSGSLTAIIAAGGNGLMIGNGTVTAWGGGGIDASGCANTLVTDVVATYNAGNGIALGSTSRANNCVASFNGLAGVSASSGCILAQIVANQNTGNGLYAFRDNCLLDCNASSNGGLGILTDSYCTVRNCVASYNTGTGVPANLGTGIQCSFGCTITACAVDQNTGNGISADSGSTLLQNAASFNTLAGIITFAGCTVANCNANQNGGDGIRVGYACLVSQSNAFGNGGSVAGSAGIHATNSGNRIDGNVSSSNIGTGILSDGGTDSDITVRNNCAANSAANYNPASGATFGGISVTANSAGAWSNF